MLSSLLQKNPAILEIPDDFSTIITILEIYMYHDMGERESLKYLK
jgi:hypothetical protein